MKSKPFVPAKRIQVGRTIKLGVLGLLTTLFAVMLLEIVADDGAIEAEKRRLRELAIPITLEEYRRLAPQLGLASKYVDVAREIDQMETLANKVLEFGSLDRGLLESYQRYAMALTQAHAYNELHVVIHQDSKPKEISQEDEWSVTRLLVRLALVSRLIAPFDSARALRLIDLYSQVRSDLIQDALLDRMTITYADARCFDTVATVLDHHPHDLDAHRRLQQFLEELEPDDQRLAVGSTIISDNLRFADIMSGAYQYTLSCEPEPTLAIKAYRSGVAARDFNYRRWRIARIAAESWLDPKLTAVEAEQRTQEIQDLLFPKSPLQWKGRLYSDLRLGFGEAHSLQMDITAKRNAALATLWLSTERASKGAMPGRLPERQEFADPYTGKPLHHKLIDGNIFVYSLGVNGKDESPAQAKMRPGGDDIGLRR